MSALDPLHDPGNASRGDAKWDKLNAEHGGRLEERAHAIRSGPWGLTRIEAKIAALAEIGLDNMAVGDILGVDEHTIHNHHAIIRKKRGLTRKQCAFDMLFLQPPPFHRKEVINNKNRELIGSFSGVNSAKIVVAL